MEKKAGRPTKMTAELIDAFRKLVDEPIFYTDKELLKLVNEKLCDKNKIPKRTFMSYKLGNRAMNNDMYNELIKILLKNEIKKNTYLINKIGWKSLAHKFDKKIIEKGEGYIYLIKVNDYDYYKIGISKNTPYNRLSGLQSGCPFELSIIDVYVVNNYRKMENILHNKYKKYHTLGEWFKFDNDMINKVKNDLKLLSENMVVQTQLF